MVNRKYGSSVAWLAALALLATACSGDVTESDEYRALATERDGFDSTVSSLEGQVVEVSEVLESTQVDLEEVEQALSDGESELIEAESRGESLDAELDEALSGGEALTLQIEALTQQIEDLTLQVEEAESHVEGLADEFEELGAYPDFMVMLFIEGCMEGVLEDPTLTRDEAVAFCGCSMEALEETLSLNEFFEFSLAFVDPDTEFDHFTGFPVGVGQETIRLLTTTSLDCIFELT